MRKFSQLTNYTIQDNRLSKIDQLRMKFALLYALIREHTLTKVRFLIEETAKYIQRTKKRQV